MQLLNYYFKVDSQRKLCNTLEFERDMATNEQQDYHEQKEG